MPMLTAQQSLGELKIPRAEEAERGLASIALNHPNEFLHKAMEARLSPSDFADSCSKLAVEVSLEQTTRNATTDMRVVYEKMRIRMPDLQVYQVSELFTYCPLLAPINDYIEIVRSASKRRALLLLAYDAIKEVQSNDQSTSELIGQVSMRVDALLREQTPVKGMDIKELLLDAAQRYQNGDDSALRIATGYSKLDDICPIRFGDYVVIGGETKSGKTMLALNIVSNLLTK